MGSSVSNRKTKTLISRVREWDEGTPLDFAWFSCVSPETRRKYESCENDAKRAYLRVEMRFEVLDDLVDGKLVALGMLEGAPVEEGPVTIPSHLFPRESQDKGAIIDWDSSTLSSAGHRFVRIRVRRPEPIANSADSSNATNTEDNRTSEPSQARMGRPSKDAQIREILQQLKTEGWQFSNLLQKESCQRIVEMAKTRGFDTTKGYSDPVLKRLIRESQGDRSPTGH